MTCPSADLPRQWRTEREDHVQAINDLRCGVTGTSLTPAQRQVATNRRATALADIGSLIADFGLCESFPILLHPANSQPGQIETA